MLTFSNHFDCISKSAMALPIGSILLFMCRYLINTLKTEYKINHNRREMINFAAIIRIVYEER